MDIFPGSPITPGVILIETMAQIGATAFGIYLLACQKKMRPGQMNIPLSLFSSADGVEFNGIVVPGERVIVKGKKNYFRKGVLKVDTTMERENGEIVCLGTLIHGLPAGKKLVSAGIGILIRMETPCKVLPFGRQRNP